MPLLILLGGAGGGAPPFDPAPYADLFGEGTDTQQLRSTQQRWVEPGQFEAQATPVYPVIPFDPRTVDWGDTTGLIRSTQVRWFDAPEAAEPPVYPTLPVVPFDPATGFPWQEQPQDWRGEWLVEEGWDQSSPHPGYGLPDAPTITVAQGTTGAGEIDNAILATWASSGANGPINRVDIHAGPTTGTEALVTAFITPLTTSSGVLEFGSTLDRFFFTGLGIPLDSFFTIRFRGLGGYGPYSAPFGIVHLAPNLTSGLGSDTPERDRTQRWVEPGLFIAEPPVYPTLPAVTVTTAQLAGVFQEQTGLQRSQPWLPSDVQIGISTESTADTTGCWFDTATALAPDWWARVGEAAGSTIAADEVGSLDGTYVNSPTLEATADLTGDTSTAVLLTGASGHQIVIPDGTALDGGDVFTVAVRFKRTTISTLMVMMDKGVTGGTGWAIVWAVENTIRLSSASVGTTVVKSLPITDIAGWHTAIFTKNGATARCYIDGVDVSVAGTNVTFSNTTDDLIIGSEQSGTLPYTGIVDEPMYFKRALSANEAAELHASAHCDATAYEYVGPINDTQPWKSNQARWFDGSLTTDAPVYPTLPTAVFDPATVDWGYDPARDRSFRPWNVQPDQEWHPTATGDGPGPTGPSTEQLAPLWGNADETQQLQGNRPRWYDRSVEPVDGTLQSWLYTTGSPGVTPVLLIDATTGDVYIYIGSNLMVPAS